MILEEATKETFGYYSSDLLPQSGKFILAICDNCYVIRITSKHAYRSLCVSCALRKRIVAEKTGQKIGKSNTGKKRTKKSRRLMSNVRMGMKFTREHKQHLSESHKGQTSPMKGKKHTIRSRQKMSVSTIKSMHNSPPAMTAPEKVFEAICIKNNLPFVCNVSAKKHIGSAVPDFIHKTKKIVVEVFGNFWHGQWEGNRNIVFKQTVEGRSKQLKVEGYKLIVFWERDLMRLNADKFVLRELRKVAISGNERQKL